MQFCLDKRLAFETSAGLVDQRSNNFIQLFKNNNNIPWLNPYSIITFSQYVLKRMLSF